MKPLNIVDALGLSLVSSCLALLTCALVVLPQRIAQRPAQRGILALHLAADGGLRLWNRPVRAQELAELLPRLADHPDRNPPVLRLLPDPAVPWGVVRQAAVGLEASGVALELQLP